MAVPPPCPFVVSREFWWKNRLVLELDERETRKGEPYVVPLGAARLRWAGRSPEEPEGREGRTVLTEAPF